MKIMTEVIIARFKSCPHRQREAFMRYDKEGRAEAFVTAMYMSDSLPAKEAMRGRMDKIYQDMAVAHETGVHTDPWGEKPFDPTKTQA